MPGYEHIESVFTDSEIASYYWALRIQFREVLQALGMAGMLDVRIKRMARRISITETRLLRVFYSALIDTHLVVVVGLRSLAVGQAV